MCIFLSMPTSVNYIFASFERLGYRLDIARPALIPLLLRSGLIGLSVASIETHLDIKFLHLFSNCWYPAYCNNLSQDSS